MAKLLLFDIDNTLVFTGGAGARALNLAFAQLFGVEDGFAGVDFAGRTDISIFREAAEQHRLDGYFEALLDRFKEAYHHHLALTLPQAEADGGGRVLPGVKELLEALQTRRDTLLGVATGNFRRGALMKLNHYGLSYFFSDGAYGDDAEERAQLVAIAIRRLMQQMADDTREVYIIGDTPLDISAAKANDAIAVAVATGRHSQAQLRDSGADLVLPDLSQWQTLWQRLFASP
ncbi:MAG: HAD family hydrolase [Dehalococcoidia bacterium]